MAVTEVEKQLTKDWVKVFNSSSLNLLERLSRGYLYYGKITRTKTKSFY